MKRTLYVCLALLLPVASASAVELLSENFDSVTLGPAVDESPTFENAWSATPPAGWNVEIDREMPENGITEWYGWTFANPEFWVSADDQRRSEFTLGQNVVAVADPDEYDDGDAEIDPDLFNSSLFSPTVDVTGIAEVTITFDSSWRDEDLQTAVLNALFDTGTVNIFTWSSDSGSDDFKDDAPNETVSYTAAVPSGATSMGLEFAMPQAGNDWWWAIDNVSVEGTLVPEPNAVLLLLCGFLGCLSFRRK